MDVSHFHLDTAGPYERLLSSRPVAARDVADWTRLSCARRVVTFHPVVWSRSLPGRTSSPAARSASGWAAYVRRDAGTSTHPYRRATSRAPCCDGRRSRSTEPAMPCSRASNSRRPDLVVSLDCLMFSFRWLTQHVPPSVVNERPGVGTIESAHADRCNQLRIEVAEVDAVLAARSGLHWFPVCDTPTRPAMYGAQSSVSPDVLCGCFRMPLDFDGTVLKVHPRPTNAPALGTVAGGGNLWRRRQFHPNCAAVA
jgi:hypothetical protein